MCQRKKKKKKKKKKMIKKQKISKLKQSREYGQLPDTLKSSKSPKSIAYTNHYDASLQNPFQWLLR